MKNWLVITKEGKKFVSTEECYKKQEGETVVEINERESLLALRYTVKDGVVSKLYPDSATDEEVIAAENAHVQPTIVQ
jgi:hypothetical protein